MLSHENFISFFADFNQAQRKRFYSFLKSPYHNTNKALIRYWKLIMAQLKKGKEKWSPTLEKRLYRKLFPTGTSDLETQPKVVKNLDSKMVAAYEQFMIQEALQAEPMLKAILIYKSLNNHFKGTSYRLQAERFKSIFEDTAESIEKYKFQHDFLWEVLGVEHSNQFKTDANNLEKAIRQLDVYYLTQKLLYQIQVRTLAAGSEGVFPSALFDLSKIQGWRNKEVIDQLPALCQAYALLYLVDSDGGAEWEKQLAIFLNKKAKELGKKGRREFVTGVANYYNKQVKEGKKAYQQQHLDVLELAFDNKWLHLDDGLEAKHLDNLITLSLKYKQVNQAEKYLNKFKSELAPQAQETCILYNQIRIWIRQDKLKAAQQGLNRFFAELKKEIHYRYVINGYIYQLQLFYLRHQEMDLYDVFLSGTNSFQKMIARIPQLSEVERESYHNFIRVMKDLFPLTKQDEEAGRILMNKIAELPGLPLRDWLEAEMENKFGLHKL